MKTDEMFLRVVKAENGFILEITECKGEYTHYVFATADEVCEAVAEEIELAFEE